MYFSCFYCVLMTSSYNFATFNDKKVYFAQWFGPLFVLFCVCGGGIQVFPYYLEYIIPYYLKYYLQLNVYDASMLNCKISPLGHFKGYPSYHLPVLIRYSWLPFYHLQVSIRYRWLSFYPLPVLIRYSLLSSYHLPVLIRYSWLPLYHLPV